MSDRTPAPPTLPTALATRYVLVEPLASGGSAEVWRGTDQVLDRPVAVKVLHRHLLTDATTRARLAQEARAAAALAHPGIVAVYDAAIDDGAAAVVLELVEGRSLADRLRDEGPIPARDAVRLAAEVAEALAHAHERGVVHRDVKAANVLLGPDGEARLTDFGIARVLDDAAARMTDTGTIAGTLLYLAPEQVRGEPAGPPADIYAVGVLLAEMLSGRPPYEVNTPLALAEAQQTPPMAVEGAAPALAAIVRRTLDPDPAGRPPSAAALAVELRAWLAGDAAPGDRPVATDAPTLPAIPVAAAAAVPPPSAPEASTTAPPGAPSDEAGPYRPGRRAALSTITLIAAGSALALLVALLVLLALTGEPPGPAASASPTSSAQSPSPSPTATPSPTPVPVPSLAEAIDAFESLVDAGEADGLIESDAADELRELAADVGEAVEEGTQGDVNRAIRDLRRAVERFAQDGRIGSDVLASDLASAVNEIERAAARAR